MRSTISVFTEQASGLTHTYREKIFGYHANDERGVNTVRRNL